MMMFVHKWAEDLVHWEEKYNLTHILPIGERSYALGFQSQRKACVLLLAYHNYLNISDYKLHCVIISACSERSQSLWQSKNNYEVNTILNLEQICDM